MIPARGFRETYFCSEDSPKKSLFLPKDGNKQLANLIVPHPQATQGASLRMELQLGSQSGETEVKHVGL